MKTPTVSIIIPAYNAKIHVTTCIDSIINLSFTDWECIIIDDGSTDNTGDILDSYVSEENLRLYPIRKKIKVIHKSNGGVSSARNVGLELARGEWICFVDIDDSLSNDYLLDTEFTTPADLILKKVCLSNSAEEYHPIQPGMVSGESKKTFLEQHLYCSKFLTPWAKLFRRILIEKQYLHFNPSYKFGEDTLFVLSYIKDVREIKISGQGSYFYTVTPFNKYIFPVTKAIEYMQDFSTVFFALGLDCPEMIKRMLIWHSSFTSDFNLINKFKWYTDYSVNRLYRYAYRLFPMSMKIKIRLYSIISLLFFYEK